MYINVKTIIWVIAASIITLNVKPADCANKSLSNKKVIGINHDMLWTPEDKIDDLISIMKEAGATAIRIPIRWTTVEPEQGKWDYKKADMIIRKLRNADIRILGSIMSFPAWENKTAGKTVEGWYDTYPPENTENWEKYVYKTVYRYKKEISDWEIWNEENGVDFWRPVPDVEKYMSFLKSAYKSCKTANPGCKVILGGLQMNGIIPNPWSPVKTPDFLQAIYDAGGKNFFDVVNTHPYVLPRENEGAEYMKKLTIDTIKVMRKNGDLLKPLWITEIGCGTSEEDTEEDQAKLLEESFDALYSLPQVKAVFWFTLRDYEMQITGPEDSMGIVTSDNKKKPSFYAFQRVAYKHKK